MNTATTTDSAINKPWYQHKMVWMVVGLPLLSVIVGTSFVIIAVNGGDDVVRDNYYKEGKGINQLFDEDEQARQQAISGEVSFDNERGAMQIELAAVSQPFIRFSLFHSARREFDLAGALAKVSDTANGAIYEYSFESVPNGQWYLEIKGDDGQGKNIWRLRHRVVLPTEQVIALRPTAQR